MDLAINQTSDEPTHREGLSTRNRGWVFGSLILCISAFVMFYAVTRAFVWDAGYHLMAATQISLGKLPYIDFCFPQTPLNAYLNAAVIKLFGQQWRPIHAVATLFSLGSMLFTAQYILAHFPARNWRLGCGLTAAVFVGLNDVVVQFGTIGQAYGICLFFTVAAYRVALATPARVSIFHPLACGVLAGIAAGSSLLTAPILAAILIWIFVYDRVGLPWRKALAFIAGAAIPFLPVVWLYWRGPKQTFFNIAKYHALYRRIDWPTSMAVHHDLLVFTSWLDSTQALTLILLAVVGVVFIVKRSDWQRSQRAEFYLAAWVSLAEGAYLCTPHPTFGRYFIFLTPFMTILAMAGLYAVAEKMGYGGRPFWPAALASGLMALMFVSWDLQSYDQTTWEEYEKVAKKVIEVTPPGGKIFADEVVYFILQTSPPSGMECSYTHALNLPPREEKLFHVVSEPELKQQFERHEFATVQSCSDPEMERLGLPSSYRYKNDIDECTVFWGTRPLAK